MNRVPRNTSSAVGGAVAGSLVKDPVDVDRTTCQCKVPLLGLEI